MRCSLPSFIIYLTLEDGNQHVCVAMKLIIQGQIGLKVFYEVIEKSRYDTQYCRYVGRYVMKLVSITIIIYRTQQGG